jgi:hypothetical protein
MPSADLTSAWNPFQSIASSRCTACARVRVAQHVVSTIICWCSLTSDADGNFSAKKLDSSQVGHCSRRINHTAISAPSRAAVVLPLPSGFSRLMESLVPECWRDPIVAGRCRKSSTSFVASGLCQLRHQFAGHMVASMYLYWLDPEGRTALRTVRLCSLNREGQFVFQAGEDMFRLKALTAFSDHGNVPRAFANVSDTADYDCVSTCRRYRRIFS